MLLPLCAFYEKKRRHNQHCHIHRTPSWVFPKLGKWHLDTILCPVVQNISELITSGKFKSFAWSGENSCHTVKIPFLLHRYLPGCVFKLCFLSVWLHLSIFLSAWLLNSALFTLFFCLKIDRLEIISVSLQNCIPVITCSSVLSNNCHCVAKQWSRIQQEDMFQQYSFRLDLSAQLFWIKNEF